MKPLTVLSLFNGMNTGRQALENVGIPVEAYYSSEIKKAAITLTQHHFPDTIQLGNINGWRSWPIDWANVDIVLSGSPCQDLSAAGKRAGIHGAKSRLFFTFIEILNHIRALSPNVLFFQENVGSALRLDVGIMSRELGVYPVRINSSLLTAQLRDRYYWTNIRTRRDMFDLVTDIPQPIDKGIMFQDILTSGCTDREKSLCLAAAYYKSAPLHTFEKYKKRYDIGMLQIVFESLTEARLLNKIEMCRLQGFPEDYCDILTDGQAASLLGDGWTLPIIEHIFSFIES